MLNFSWKVSKKSSEKADNWASCGFTEENRELKDPLFTLDKSEAKKGGKDNFNYIPASPEAPNKGKGSFFYAERS